MGHLTIRCLFQEIFVGLWAGGEVETTMPIELKLILIDNTCCWYGLKLKGIRGCSYYLQLCHVSIFHDSSKSRKFTL